MRRLAIAKSDEAPWPSFLRRAAETRLVLERRVQLSQQDATRLARESVLGAARPRVQGVKLARAELKHYT